METKFKPVLQTKIDQDADKQKRKEKKDRPRPKRKKIRWKDNLCVIFMELAVKTVFYTFLFLLAGIGVFALWYPETRGILLNTVIDGMMKLKL